MNVKLSDLQQGSVLTELQHLKKLQRDKKLVDEYFIRSRGVSSPSLAKGKERFLLHPKRILSDSESSADSLASSALFNFDRDNLEENKLKIKNSRKKLYKNLTITNTNQFYDIDVGIGDSCKVNVRNIESAPVKKETIATSNKNPNNKNSGKNLDNRNAPAQLTKIIITDSVFEKKFNTFVEKSLHVISEIRFQLEKGITPPDGDEDMSRRQLRVKEFANRFSRNYLYPLARQMTNIDRMTSSTPESNHKLLSAYQIILNGLQAYQNHLPTSIGLCSSDKLKTLLNNLLNVCDMHTALVKDNHEYNCSEALNVFRESAESTLQKIENHFSIIATETLLKSCTKTSLDRPKMIKNIKGNRPKKNSLAARLSMYATTCSFRRDVYWRQAVDAADRRRQTVKSRYKTAQFCHRPQPEKPSSQPLETSSKCRFIAKKLPESVKKSPRSTPVSDIATMVEMTKNYRDSDDDGVSSHPDQQQDGQWNCSGSKMTENEERQIEDEKRYAEAAAIQSQEDIVVQLLQLVLDNNRRKATGGGENQGAAEKINEEEKGGDKDVGRKAKQVRDTPNQQDQRQGDKASKVSLNGVDQENGEEKERSDNASYQSQDGIVVQLLQLVLDKNTGKGTGGEEKGEMLEQDVKENGKANGGGDGTTQLAQVMKQLKNNGCMTEEMLQHITKLRYGERTGGHGDDKRNQREQREQQEDELQELELKVVPFEKEEISEAKKNKKKKKRKEPNVIVSGAGNAKLICIKDINSTDEATESDDNEKTKVTSSSTSQPHKERKRTKKTIKSKKRSGTLKLKRAKKNAAKSLKLLPKDYALNIIQYKLDYHKHCKNRPMYRKTRSIIPWKLIGKMSDEILDEVLLGITREIELDDVLENIYQSELQM